MHILWVSATGDRQKDVNDCRQHDLTASYLEVGYFLIGRGITRRVALLVDEIFGLQN